MKLKNAVLRFLIAAIVSRFEWELEMHEEVVVPARAVTIGLVSRAGLVMEPCVLTLLSV